MFNHRIVCLLSIIVILAGIFGCSSGHDPTIPENTGYDSENLPVIALTQTDDMSNAIGLMGAYDLRLFPINQNAELIAKRNSAIGESYIVNGKSFFTITPCTSCLSIKSISLTPEGLIDLTFEIRHPFKPGDPFKPPTAVNRLDLDVFDMALLIRPLDTSPTAYPLTHTDAYSGLIANSSGYTTELGNVIGDNTAIPFVLVIDDNTADAFTYNEFPMGAETLFDVVFDVVDRTDFELFLTMGYGASAKKADRLNPTYFNPEFNRKSAWKVIVTPPNGSNPPTIGNTWNDKDSTTLFPVTVEVFDWQIGANVNPELTNPDDIYAASGVSKVSLEIPGMNTSLIEKTTSDGGSGTPSDPLIYTLSTANENLLVAGEYIGLVKVFDERIPGVSIIGGETDTLASSPNGILLEWFDIPEFATYQTFTATVVVGCGPITGSVTSHSCPINNVINGQNIDFTVSASSGNGGDPIVLYEVDYDYDNVTFTSDASNTDGIFDDVGPFTVPNPCPSNIPRTYKVAFRATDSCVPPNMTIFTTCDVIVESCDLFVGDLTVIAINRGENAEDPERITSLDFDWDDALGAVEYALERSDGYNPVTWTVAGVSTTSSYKWVPSGSDLDNDIRFRVIARAEVGGNPLTDSDPSEEVFTIFMCNGGTMTGNFWALYQESMQFRFASWWGGVSTPDVDNWPVGSNRNFMGLYYGNPSSLTECWALARTPQPVPDLVGQKRAFCDGYWVTNYPWTSTMGMCVGTLSVPTPSGTEVCDFHPSNEIYGTGLAYNRSGSGVNSQFCLTNQDAWVFPPGVWMHVGYYLNDLCDDGPRDYIAFGWANGGMAEYDWISGYSDGFAFVVD